MIKAIIFDLDDTLLMTRQTKYEALKFAAKHFYRLTITDDEIDKQWGKPFQAFMFELFRGCDSVENLCKTYKSIIHQFPNKPYPDTIPVLDELEKTFSLGILSTTAHDLAINDLECSGVGVERFGFIQSEEDTTHHKPEPEVFEPTIEQFQSMGVMPQEMLYVGDAYTDYLASSRAGLYFIGIPRLEKEQYQFNSEHIPIISSLEELPAKLETV